MSALCIFLPARMMPVTASPAHPTTIPEYRRSKCPQAIASSPYEALVGGRPDLSVPLERRDLRRLIYRKAKEGEIAEEREAPTRVWLDLTNGESLSLTFEKLRDDHPGTCTLRVKQTRLLDECRVDDPTAQCADLGCVAVRWNLLTREGVLIDLFKAKKGERVGCDLSSADSREVKWGELMLRVVDDVASLLGCRHVYLADESSVRIDTWDAHSRVARSQQVMLKYLKPLIDGIGYYERFGYFTIERSLYYGFNGAARHASRSGSQGTITASEVIEEGRSDDGEKRARNAASVELSSFEAVRTAPFRSGGFASALEFAHASEGGEKDISVVEGLKKAHQAQKSTFINRFAEAVGAAQDAAVEASHATDCRTADEHVLVSAFRTAVVEGDAKFARVGGPMAGQVATYATLETLFERFDGALDAELLGARHFGAMIRILRDRNRLVVTESGREEGGATERQEVTDEPSRLLAGSLLLFLMFEFYAAYPSRKALPLKRKDYYHHRRSAAGGASEDDHNDEPPAVSTDEEWASLMSAVHMYPSSAQNTGVIRVDADGEHVPIVREAFLLCGVDEAADECVLPWA